MFHNVVVIRGNSFEFFAGSIEEDELETHQRFGGVEDLLGGSFFDNDDGVKVF